MWTEQEKVRKHREKEEALRAAEATGTLADATSVVIPEESESEDEASEVWHANIAEESLPSKTASVPSLVTIPTDLPSEFTGLEERIGTTLSSPELPHDRPGARDLQTSHTNNSTTISPSVLATARHIEDINSISYSEGIKNPEDEFDITAQEGNFLYVSSTRDIPKRLSPVVLTRSVGTASVVKMQSLLSDPYMKSSFASNASRVRLTRPGTRPASFLRTGSSESETPDSSRRQSAFLQHSKYFFKDGNVTFLVRHAICHTPPCTDRPQVDGILFCVHRYFFSRDSVYFSTRFAQLGVRDHEASSTIVSLGDVECKDFEAFLSVLYPQ